MAMISPPVKMSIAKAIQADASPAAISGCLCSPMRKATRMVCAWSLPISFLAKKKTREIRTMTMPMDKVPQFRRATTI